MGILTAGPALGQAKLDAAVEQTLSEIGSARVLVTMVPPKIGEAPFGPFEEPAAFVSGVLEPRGRNVQRIVDLPIAVAETDRLGIAALVDSPQVAYIAADEPVPPLLQTSLGTLNADQVHAVGVLGTGQSVAVLDTGVHYDHPFFGGKLRAEGCFSTPQSSIYTVNSLCGNGLEVDLTDGAGRACDLDGCDHGTHVAGIAIGAATSTVDGVITGTAPNAGLISIQVFTRFDDIRVCGRDSVPCIRSFPSDQLRALRHVRSLSATHDVASVNMSLGNERFHDAACDDQSPMTAEIARLRALGILTVVPSGNRGYFNAVGSPACVSAAITVGGSRKDRVELDLRYSNTSALVDFLAPGTEIVSAIGVGYGARTGTSMAAPHVAGLIALLKSRVPSATADAVESSLRSTARVTSDPRTGLRLYFPDARSALEDLATFGENASNDADFASLRGLVGVKRLLIRQGVSNPTPDAALRRIRRALGRHAVVRAFDENTYLAESRSGFDIGHLTRLMDELGTGARLYWDEPVAPETR